MRHDRPKIIRDDHDIPASSSSSFESCFTLSFILKSLLKYCGNGMSTSRMPTNNTTVEDATIQTNIATVYLRCRGHCSAKGSFMIRSCSPVCLKSTVYCNAKRLLLTAVDCREPAPMLYLSRSIFTICERRARRIGNHHR